MSKKAEIQKLTVLNREVAVQTGTAGDFICLTDIARYRDQERTDSLIFNWMRNRNTVEFLGLWEHLHNPNFKPIEFDGFRKQAGLNSFVLTPKQWIERTGAIGIESRAGRYGGTFAHPDIAFEFASWISVEFRLYLIKEFQRLKAVEQEQLGWDVRRNLAKINYRMHTDAIQKHLIPSTLTKAQVSFIYATEADVLNVALFGMTASDWRKRNSGAKGNIRDQATAAQLVCLSNLENFNALFIREGMPQRDRLTKLNQIAIDQMKLLTDDTRVQRLDLPET